MEEETIMRGTTSDDIHIEDHVPDPCPKERSERQKRPNDVAHPTSSSPILRSVAPQYHQHLPRTAASSAQIHSALSVGGGVKSNKT